MNLNKTPSALFIWGFFLSGALLHVLALPPFALPELAFMCLALPALGLIFVPTERKVIWRAAFVSGVLSWTGLLIWLRHIGELVGLGALGGWAALLFLSVVLSGFWTLWWCAAARLLPFAGHLGGIGRVILMAALAALWVFLEWLRSWVLTGFPWLPLAASQWERPALLQVAAWTGAWGVSFILVFFNLGLALYVRHLARQRKGGGWLSRLSPEFYAAILVLLGSLFLMPGAGWTASRGEASLRVAPVQPDIAQNLKWDPAEARSNRAALERQTRFADLLKPDLILWPEAVTPTPVVGDPGMRRWVEELAAEMKTPILFGSVAVFDAEEGEARQETIDHSVNAVFVADPETGISINKFYAKRKLVPLGEYVPLRPLFFFLEQLTAFDDLRAGETATVLPLFIDFRTYRAGSLICYEDIFPHLARANVLAGADFHFVATNNSWYGQEGMAYQHASHSVLRAVETRRPVLRVGNNGWSGWIDEFGVIRHVLKNSENSVYFGGTDVMEVRFDADWRGQHSFYVTHGDWFIALCAALALALPWLRGKEMKTSPAGTGGKETAHLSEARQKARSLLRKRKLG